MMNRDTTVTEETIVTLTNQETTDTANTNETHKIHSEETVTLKKRAMDSDDQTIGQTTRQDIKARTTTIIQENRIV